MSYLETHKNKEIPKWKNQLISMAVWVVGKAQIKISYSNPNQIRGNDRYLKALESLKTSPKVEETQPIETTNKELKDTPKSAYETAKHILSPEGKTLYLAKLEEILSTPEAIEILELYQKNSATFDDPEPDSDQKKVRVEIENQLNKFNPTFKANILRAQEKKLNFQKKGEVLLVEDQAIKTISDLIASPPNKTSEYHFKDLFKLRPVGATNVSDYTICTDTSQKISIPLNLIIGATQFTSWNGHDSSELKKGKLSLDLIKEYASLDTSPTVEEMTMFVYPSGEVFFQTHNSHRVAAMKIRGDKTIDFQGKMGIVVMGEEDKLPL